MNNNPFRITFRIDPAFFILGLLVCAWGLAEFLYPPTQNFYERSVPKLVHACICVWSFLCVCYDLLVYRDVHIASKFLAPAFMLSCVLFFFPFLATTNEVKSMGYLQSQIYAGIYMTQWFVILLFCTIHAQSKPDGYLSFQYLVPLMIFFFFIATFRHIQQNIADKGNEEFQSGIFIGYYLVSLFPFVWNIRNQILKYVLILMIVYASIASMKRGAMLCLVASLVVAFGFHYVYFATGRKRIPYLFAMTIGSIIIASFFVYSISQKESLFEQRMQNLQSGSGRFELYQETIKVYNEADLMGKFFGIHDRLHYPHNDFLFVLINYGLLGEVFFVIFEIGIFSVGFRMLRLRDPLIPACMANLITIFIVQMVSYGFAAHTFGICCIFLGMTQGLLTFKRNSAFQFAPPPFAFREIIYEPLPEELASQQFSPELSPEEKEEQEYPFDPRLGREEMPRPYPLYPQDFDDSFRENEPRLDERANREN